jgi:hypothetical protein
MRVAGAAAAGGRTRGDSVRGQVVLVGQAPARRPMLRLANGDELALSGMVVTSLLRLEGAEIVARGTRVSPRDMVLRDFVVRAERGVPVLDGRIVQSDGGVALELTDGGGRRPLTAVPAALRAMVGSRVWVTVPERGAVAFGVIR